MRGITRSPSNLTRSLCDDDHQDDDDDDDYLYIVGAVCLSFCLKASQGLVMMMMAPDDDSPLSTSVFIT